MCNFVAAGANMVQGFMKGAAAKEQSKAQAAIYEINAKTAEYQAVDAERRGAIAETNYRNQIEKFRGTQKVTAAANGLRADSGTIQDLLDDTTRTGEVDALTIRSNAAREAYGYRAKAQDMRNNASFVRKQGKTQMILDIHGGIAAGASSFF